MPLTNSPSANKQIRNLLLVIFSGVAFAVIVSSLLLYRYNPSGQYLLANTLLSPSMAYQMHFSQTTGPRGQKTEYLFDHIEFSHYNDQESKWQKQLIDEAAYARVYKLLSADQSLTEKSEQTAQLFNEQLPASLVIYMRSNQVQQASEVLPFMEIQFAKSGDYYRLKPYVQSSSPSWIYFHHDNVYSKVFQALNL